MPRVLLPLGISFFTFHAISYVVDVYRGDATAQKSPVHAALYLLLFPQLIAGPIIRYRDIADQLARRVVTLDDFAEGVRRFVIGLGKKVLIANVVAGPADQIFGLPPAELDAPHAWLGDRLLHAADLLRLLRLLRHGHRPRTDVRLPLPRELPLAVRRRHACRSSGGDGTCRCRPGFATTSTCRSAATASSPARTYRNLVIVFFLCGLWHGASWNFVIWGLFHGTFLVIERAGSGVGSQASLAAASTRRISARRDDRLGVLPRRHAADRHVVPADDVRTADGDRANAVHARVVSDAGGLARACRRRRRIGADRSSAVAWRTTHSATVARRLASTRPRRPR